MRIKAVFGEVTHRLRAFPTQQCLGDRDLDGANLAGLAVEFEVEPQVRERARIHGGGGHEYRRHEDAESHDAEQPPVGASAEEEESQGSVLSRPVIGAPSVASNGDLAADPARRCKPDPHQGTLPLPK